MNKRKGSYHLGSAFGIGIYVHWSFALLLGWVFIAGLSGGLMDAVQSVAFVALIFGCIVLHELGHSMAARAYGIPTLHITLYPIGGVAQLERMPRNPKHELWIAVAGPAVNVAIIGVLVTLSMLLGLGSSITGFSFNPQAGLISSLISINAILILFNMIPAFPMDGGRVLRALLSMKHGHLKATLTSAKMGKILAVALGVFGLFILSNPFLIITAVFVYQGAEMERIHAMREAQAEAMRGYSVIDVEGIPVRGR